jgi:glyoxylase-like metal-dependent hydrolase (beta-lactamase superfamily II)
MSPDIRHFYHEQSNTFSYVVSDPLTSAAAIIDPVRGYSAAGGHTDTKHAGRIVNHVEKHGLNLKWILETHAHADHLSAAQYLKARLGGEVAIGEGIRNVQAHFGAIFNFKEPFAADGHQFDRLLKDKEEVSIGNLRCRVMHTPGHTNDSVSYLIGNAAFVGDTVFMTDFGTARCDFPGGDAGLLFESVQKLFALPEGTVFYLCHDYPPSNRERRFQVSMAEQIADNIHVGGGVGKEEFITMREARDAVLSLPELILPSIQVNIQAGHLPRAEHNGIAYIRIPLDVL